MVAGYGLVQWAGPITSLVFTPILTRILTPSDYGVAEYVFTLASAVGAITLFALPQALTTHFNDHPEDQTWGKSLIGAALMLATLLSVPASLGLVTFAQPIALATFHEPRYTILFQILGASATLGASNAILTTAAQAALQVRWGMLFSLTTLVATILGNLGFIIIFHLGVTGIVLTTSFVSAALAVVTFWRMSNLIGRPSKLAVTILMQSGAVLLPTVIASWVIQVADRLFLVNYVSAAALGYYSIANKMVGLLNVGLTPIYTAWTPLALSIQHRVEAKTQYANMARYLLLGTMTAVLGLGLFSKEVLALLTQPAYFPAAPYVGYLAYTHVFGAIGNSLAIGAMAGKELKLASFSVVTGAITNLVLNVVLIPIYGVWGATLATIIAAAVPQIILYSRLQKKYHIPYAISKLLAAMFLSFGILTVALFIPSSLGEGGLATRIVLFAVWLVLCRAIGIFTHNEMQRGWAIVRQTVLGLIG